MLTENERANLERPPCPHCEMHMVSTDRSYVDSQRKTFKCLRCGYIDGPKVQPKVA